VTTPLELLRGHVGHRCTVQEPTPLRSLTVRCIDCARTVDLSGVLGLRPSAVQSTSTSTVVPLNINDPAGCPQHPGYSARACGPCRSEQLAADEPLPVLPAGAPMPDDFRQQVQAARRTT
jgi:hypothetical protein